MKVSLLVALATLLVLSGCGTLDNKASKINEGDTRETVIAVMGKPDKDTKSGKYECLQYCVSGAGIGFNDHKDFHLSDGIVSSIEPYRTYETGCTSQLQVVQFPKDNGFTVDAAKKTCMEFGFQDGTTDLANCIMTQQRRSDGIAQNNEQAAQEQQRIDQADRDRRSNEINARLERDSTQQAAQQAEFNAFFRRPIQQHQQQPPPSSYQQPPPSNYQQPAEFKRTDFNCLNNCTAAGSMYNFCKSKCSY